MIRTTSKIVALLAVMLGVAESGGMAAAPAEEPEMVTGEHCLSRLHHSNSYFVTALKTTLSDPGSFVEQATTITPVGSSGRHLARMQYRTSAGSAVAYAAIDHVTCKAILLHSRADKQRLVG